jgi:hypothetical protein
MPQGSSAGGSSAGGYGVSGFGPAGFGPLWPVRLQRVQQHRQALGIFWVLYGSLLLVALLFVEVAFRTVVMGGLLVGVPPLASHILAQRMPVIVILAILISALELTAGIGLLLSKPWARVLAIAAGCLALLKVPFGTALGVYTLWVLAPQASHEEWLRLTAGE